ncbi:CDKN2AIP N-terminal-like protein [Pelodiscus sinensis]|uniref:CDKN2AIP N-terminal-like protein n=1 Tax=Pelodiscus sinensis TaxID=13735 RepID=UPI0003C463D7|nr:CDKN2AIP N-terminal-like protein [Pelodiscus sinensis]|eukprot:XP_006116118.1 CDKN2AIP N-terminal-like protein [Pelodiscus sinensis]
MVGEEEEAEFPERFRAYSENERHWQARREFILRNLPAGGAPEPASRIDQLLSLSMVWANHLFLGCSYSKDLLDKVTEMAEGIEVEDAPQFTSRDEIMKKHQH